MDEEKNLNEAAEEVTEAAEDAVENAAEKAADAVESAAETVADTVEDATETAEDAADNAVEEATEAVGDTVEEVTETVENTAETAADAAESAADNVIESIDNTSEKTAGTVDSVIKDTAYNVDTAEQDFSNLGENAVPVPEKKNSKTAVIITVCALITAAIVVLAVFLVPKLLNKSAYNKYNTYPDVSGRTIGDIVKSSDMASAYETYTLGEVIAMQMFNDMTTVDEAKSVLGLPDWVNEDTPWGEALGEAPLKNYVGEDNLDAFLEQYGLKDKANGDTLYKEVRQTVQDVNFRDFLDEYGLPADMPADTNETSAYNAIPISKVLEMSNYENMATVDEAKSYLGLPDWVDENTPWGDAIGEAPLKNFVGEENLDSFLERYGLTDAADGDTLYKEVRQTVNEADKKEREEYEKQMEELQKQMQESQSEDQTADDQSQSEQTDDQSQPEQTEQTDAEAQPAQ